MKRLKKIGIMFWIMTIGMTMIIPVYANSEKSKVIRGGDFSEKELNAFNDVSDMILVGNFVEDIDEELYAEIQDYEKVLSLEKATMKKINRKRVYNIKSKKTGEIFVTFEMLAKFQYNGKTSSCLDAYISTTNKYVNRYAILNDSTAISGNTAIGYCYARNKKTGKEFGRTMKITVYADGTVKNS